VLFEKFLGTKYIGEKRFSIEGGETSIPALDQIIHTAAEQGVEEVVIGMAHRGRLNVLVNLLGKTYEEIFNEFEGNVDPNATMGDGDVKYHLGFSSQCPLDSGKRVYLKLMPNPSHLEAVNPIVTGFARAKADAIYNAIDQSGGFYRGHAAPEGRSVMNIPFRLPSEELEDQFAKEAKKNDLIGQIGGVPVLVAAVDVGIRAPALHVHPRHVVELRGRGVPAGAADHHQRQEVVDVVREPRHHRHRRVQVRPQQRQDHVEVVHRVAGHPRASPHAPVIA
jgi:hypothetical protein